jgi:hypothetical protein
MPMTPHLRAMCGQPDSGLHRRPDTNEGSGNHASATQSEEAPLAVCLDKQGFARYLGISTRSLDRAAAVGLLPRPDLTIGRSPRWSPETITRWLRTRPRLPGRKAGDA